MKVMSKTPCLKDKSIPDGGRGSIDGYIPRPDKDQPKMVGPRLQRNITNSSTSSGSLIMTQLTTSLNSRDAKDFRESLDSAAQIDFDSEHIVLGDVIGKGAHGTVHKAEVNNRWIAVKIVKEGCKATTGHALPELELLHGVNHPNLVRTYGAHEVEIMNSSEWRKTGRHSNDWDIFETGPCHLDSGHALQKGATMQMWIFMEYCNRGSLWDAVRKGDFHLRGARSAPHFQRITEICLEIACGMRHLHEIGIIHGDLKPENVLLVQSRTHPGKFSAKIGDFGRSRRAPSIKTTSTTFSWGTVDHMAPETLRDGRVHFATDVFSFAILMVELITASKPFRGMATPVVLVAIVEGLRPQLPVYCPGALANLIKQCWNQDWQARPSFAEIVQRLINLVA